MLKTVLKWDMEDLYEDRTTSAFLWQPSARPARQKLVNGVNNKEIYKYIPGVCV